MDDITALRIWFWLVLDELYEEWVEEEAERQKIPKFKRVVRYEPLPVPIGCGDNKGWTQWVNKVKVKYPIPWEKAEMRFREVFINTMGIESIPTDWEQTIPETYTGSYSEDVKYINDMLVECQFKGMKGLKMYD